MSYEKSNRIINIQNNEDKLTEQIVIKSDKIDLSNTKKNIFNKSLNINKKNRTIFEENFTDLTYYNIPYNSTFLYVGYRTWEIKIGNVPLKFIPFINVNMIIQDNPLYAYDITQDIHKGYVYKYSELDSTGTIANNVVLYAGFNYCANRVGFILYPLKVKLLVTLLNPEEFI
jgi:hypothetical protein